MMQIFIPITVNVFKLVLLVILVMLTNIVIAMILLL